MNWSTGQVGQRGPRGGVDDACPFILSPNEGGGTQRTDGDTDVTPKSLCDLVVRLGSSQKSAAGWTWIKDARSVVGEVIRQRKRPVTVMAAVHAPDRQLRVRWQPREPGT